MRKYEARAEIVEIGQYKIYLIEDESTYEAILMRKNYWIQHSIYKMRKTITTKEQFHQLVLNGLEQAKIELLEDILEKIESEEYK